MTITVDFETDVLDGTSTATLQGPGASVSLGQGVAVDADSVAFSVPVNISDGEWVLEWSAIGVDGENLDGTSTFDVAAGVAPASTLAPATTIAADVAPETTAADAAVEEATSELLLLGAVPIIGVVIFFIGLTLYRRRDSESRWVPGGSHSSYIPEARTADTDTSGDVDLHDGSVSDDDSGPDETSEPPPVKSEDPD